MNRAFPRPRQRLALWLLNGVALLSLLLQTAPVQAQPVTPVPQAKKIIAIEGVTEYQLANGVRYLFIPDKTSSTVTVNMTVLVGSRHEGYGESGMAHLLEHMCFKGSKKFPARYMKLLQAHGADFNGTTSFDRTNYYETMPGTDENLRFGVELEADRLVNSFVKEQDLRDEMPVVRNEFELGENDPEYVLNNRLYASAYEWHNYGKVTIGNRSDIERVPIDRLKAFYKKYYRPDNIVLVVAGKFDEAKAQDYIARNFGTLARPPASLENTYTEEPAQDGERNVTLRRVGKGTTVGFMYHIPATAHPDFAPLDVLESVLLSNPSGRLYKKLVEGKKATSVHGGTGLYHDPGVFTIFANVVDGVSYEEVRDLIVVELEQLKAQPVTEEELERARRSMLAAFDNKLTNTKRLGLEMSEWIASGDWRLLYLHRERIKKVTLADLNRVGPQFFRQTNRTFGVFLPSKDVVRAKVPQTPKLAAMLKDFKGGAAVVEGETFDPTPENIERRLKRIDLPDGLKVALLPKKTKGETVIARLKLYFGNEKSLADYVDASAYLGSLMKRGTKKHNVQQLDDELDKLQATMSVSSGLGTLTLAVKAKRDTLAKVLDLAGEVLRHPTFPEDELEIFKRATKQSLEKLQFEPGPLAMQALVRKLNPYPKTDIRYRPTIAESLERLKKVTRTQLVKLYEEQVGTGKCELVVLGDFDPDATVKQFQSMLAGWRSRVPYQRIGKEAIIDVASHRQDIVTPDKENAVFFAGFTLALVDTDPNALPLKVGNYILGESTASRLFSRLREKESLSYGAYSTLQLSPLDKYGIFVIQASVNPKEIDKADKAALEELNKIIKEGISKEDLKMAQKGMLEEMKVERGSDGTLLGMLSTNLFLGRTMDYYAKQEKAIAAMPVEEVNSALRTYLAPGRLIIIRAGDFKKNKDAPK